MYKKSARLLHKKPIILTDARPSLRAVLALSDRGDRARPNFALTAFSEVHIQ
jgi:hypothetical protein